MLSNKQLVLAALAVAATLALAGRGDATEAKIRNFSNDVVKVAVAYGTGRGTVVVEGYYLVQPGRDRTISAGDAAEMYIRVLKRNQSQTWKNYNSTRLFLLFNTGAVADRFEVQMPSGAPNIRILKWGANLELQRSIRKQSGGQFNANDYPQGWSAQRFFRVGNGSHEFRLAP